MNEFELLLATRERADLVPALAWTLVHALWIGACAALLLKGGLELAARLRPAWRYAMAFGALAALPVGFAAVLARELGPRTLVPRFAGHASELVPALATGGPSALDAARAQLSGWLEPVAPWLVAAWAAGAALLVLRLVVGWIGCRRLADRALPAEPRLQARVARIGRRIGLHRRARLCLSHAIDVPMVVASGVGSTHATLLVPFRTLHELSAEDLDSVLAHELAHVRRLDGPLHLVQVLLEALFFFHPAVRWIGAQVRAEREHCCDELAVRAAGGPRVLARALAQLEERRAPRLLRRAPALAPVLAVGASDGCLVGRVERLLGHTRPARRALGGALAVCGLAGLAAGALVRPVSPVRLAIVKAFHSELREELPATAPHGARMIVLRDGESSQGREERRVQVHFVARKSDADAPHGVAALRVLNSASHEEGSWVGNVLLEGHDVRLHGPGAALQRIDDESVVR